MRNTQRSHFDAIIVLGCPSKPDGTPSENERARVDEGVREYRAGIAPRIIMTGGPAHNRYVEAQVMGALAETEGVPESAVIEEGQAHDTIQNAYYSVRIMQEHGWHSAEVVSEPSHLRRASLIFSHFPIAWRMDASQWPSDYSFSAVFLHYWHEMKMTDRLRLFGFGDTPYLHSVEAH